MALTANFSATTDREGYNPLTVSFLDQSTGGVPTYLRWNFGDGTFLENSSSPSHTYTVPGVYHVVLYVEDATSSATKIRSNYIIVNKVYYPSDNTIMMSHETSTQKYWRFYVDSDLRLSFQYGQYVYKTNDTVLDYGVWSLVEFHKGGNTFYVGTPTSQRQYKSSMRYDLGVAPVVSEDRMYVANKSTMDIDELRVLTREEDLLSYYRRLKSRASLLS